MRLVSATVTAALAAICVSSHAAAPAPAGPEGSSGQRVELLPEVADRLIEPLTCHTGRLPGGHGSAVTIRSRRGNGAARGRQITVPGSMTASFATMMMPFLM